MSRNKNKKKNSYIHPQVKLVENAGRLLKNFIEDIRHDRAFANRIFYPVLYQRKITRPSIPTQGEHAGKIKDTVIETENEFYLLKSEDYSSPGVILLALLLSNGPLVPSDKRITIDQFCDKSKEKTILARANTFINVMLNSNLFTFVFGNLSNNNDNAVGLDEVRQKFFRLTQGQEKIIRQSTANLSDTISKEWKRNQEYLYRKFEHIREADIKKTLQFIRYMCDPNNIVSEFAYRPVPNELLTNYLEYDVDQNDYLSLLTLQEKMFTTNNYDKLASEQIGAFTEIYFNAIKRSLSDAEFLVNNISNLQVYDHNDRMHDKINAMKTRIRTSLTRIHQITKQYLSSALANAIQNPVHNIRLKAKNDFIYRTMLYLRQYLEMGDENLRNQIHEFITNCNAFSETCSLSKDSLCSLIYEIIKSDVQYFKGLLRTSFKSLQKTPLKPIQKYSMKVSELQQYADAVDKYFSQPDNYKSAIVSGIYAILYHKYPYVAKLMTEFGDLQKKFDEIVASIVQEYLGPLQTQTQSNQLYSDLSSQNDKNIFGRILSGLDDMFNNLKEMKAVKEYFEDFLNDELCTGEDYYKKECNKFVNDIAQFIFTIKKIIVLILTITQIVRKDLVGALNSYISYHNLINNNYGYGSESVLELIDNINETVKLIANAQKEISNLQSEIVKRFSKVMAVPDYAVTKIREKFLPQDYENLINAINGISIRYDAKSKIAILDAELVQINWGQNLEQDLLKYYCRYYLSPILHELTSIALREGAISRTILKNSVISKDLLNLSQILTPNSVGSLVIDGNVFNDLTYFTYTFMGDKFITINPSNVDEVVDYLHSIYNLKYFNLFIIGNNDIYFYVNYAGVPIMYRGVQTKLRKIDFEKGYKWLIDAREGLYKNIKLPKKRNNQQ